jgi:hypothetical protein
VPGVVSSAEARITGEGAPAFVSMKSTAGSVDAMVVN